MQFVAREYWGDELGPCRATDPGDEVPHELDVRGSAETVARAIARLLKRVERMGHAAVRGLGEQPWISIRIDVRRGSEVSRTVRRRELPVILEPAAVPVEARTKDDLIPF